MLYFCVTLKGGEIERGMHVMLVACEEEMDGRGQKKKGGVVGKKENDRGNRTRDRKRENFTRHVDSLAEKERDCVCVHYVYELNKISPCSSNTHTHTHAHSGFHTHIHVHKLRAHGGKP